LRIADDIEANVDVLKMLDTPRKARAALYPQTLHGLNAVIFGVAGAVSGSNADAAIEAILDIGQLAVLRKSDRAFAALPLRELATAGFEMLIERCLALGLAHLILNNGDYKSYVENRKALGLA
jgi:hypothetical protein